MRPKRKLVEKESQSKSAKYRLDLKSTDPGRYRCYLKKEAERNKKSRSQLSEEKKQKQREQTCLRVKKLREKRKAEKKVEVRVGFKKKIKDMSLEEKKEYYRIRKSESRSKMSQQKKRRVKEREKGYREKRASKKAKLATLSPKAISPSLRVMSSRIRKRMPKSPNKYACSIRSLIASCSPKKKSALKNFGINSPKKIGNDETVEYEIKSRAALLKKKRNINDICTMKILKSISLGKALKLVKRSKKTVNGMLYKRKFFKIPREKIQTFYMRGDISRPVPCKKTVKKFKVLYAMETTISNAYKRYREEHPHDKISFSSFAKLKPKNVKKTGPKDLISCMCEYCVNIQLKLDCLRRIPQNKKGPEFPKLPTTVYELNELSMCCGKKSMICVERQCITCQNKIDKDLMDNILKCCSEYVVKWARYERTERRILSADENVQAEKVKMVKDFVQKSGKVSVLIDELRTELQPFSMHLFNATWQLNEFNRLISNIEDKWLITVEDFSENFRVKYQFTPQSAYWDTQSITLHPTVCFYRNPTTKEIVREGITLVTPDPIHDHFAASVFRSTVVKYLMQTRNLDIQHHVGWSDGCAGQYKSCEAFLDYSLYKHEFNHEYQHHFFGSRHAKGPSDAEGAVLKNWVDRQIVHTGCLVKTAENFVNLCQKMPEPVKNEKFASQQTVLLVKKSDIDRARLEARVTTKTVKGTQKLHSVCATETIGTLVVRTRSCFCKHCLQKQYCQVEEAGEKRIVSVTEQFSSVLQQAENYQIGDWCFAIFNDNLWPGVIEQKENDQLTISFLSPQGGLNCNRFRHPKNKDIAKLKPIDILCRSPEPPRPVTSRGDFCFEKYIIEMCIEKMKL